jgi:type II secretory pathway component GspD/PulD (secretin)
MKLVKAATLFAFVTGLFVSVNAQTLEVETTPASVDTKTSVKSFANSEPSVSLPDAAISDEASAAVESNSGTTVRKAKKVRKNRTRSAQAKTNQMVSEPIGNRSQMDKHVPNGWLKPAAVATTNLVPMNVQLSNPPAAEDEPEPTPLATSEEKPKTETKVNLLSVNVSNWELSEVLASLGAQAGHNIVLVSTLNPKVTVKLDELPFEEALRVIASVASMQVIQLSSGGYVVGSTETLKSAFPKEFEAQVGRTDATGKVIPATEEDIQTYRVKHVSPSELSTALNNLFSNEGLSVRVGPNKLSPKELTSADTGFGSGSGNSNGGSASSSAPVSTTGGNGRVLILRGPKSVLRLAMKVIVDLDVKRPQVAIKVQIHDIQDDAFRDLGITWSDSTSTRISEDNTNNNDLNFGSFKRNATAFNATIRHLEKSDKAKLLAEPNISVLDEESAYILVGDRLNFPVITSFTDAGQPVFDVKEERVGIYLQVSATVNDENSVTMKLFPQVSTVTGFLDIPQQGSYPQISTREANTSLRTKSGETVMIGGLLRDEEIKNIERVPILSKIPFFGELFTRRKTTRNKSQVVISITPTIIQGEP